MTMELRLLRYFLTVAREGNVTRAADVLHITQPTLSRQMNQLEEETGIPLFTREGRRLELTAEGILLCRRAEEILTLVDKTERELAAKEGAVDGVVSICCGEMNAVQGIADLFRTFSAAYPQVTLELYASNAELAAERIENGLADLAVFLEPVDLTKYEYIRLPIRERWAVLLPAQDPLAQKEYITAADLAGKDLIIPWRANIKKELQSWSGKYFSQLRIPIQCNMSTNAAILVYKGLGYALCLEGSRSFLDESRICRRPLYPPIETGSVLAWKKYTPFSVTVEKFIALARQYAQNRSTSGKGYAAL